MTPPERSIPELLIQGYLENSLSETEADALQAWLAEDPANVDRFAMESLLHGQLCELLGEQALRKDFLAVALAPAEPFVPSSCDAGVSPALSSGADHCLPSPACRTRQDGRWAGGEGGRPRSPVLGFLHSMLHVSGDTPAMTAVMWLVMFLCTSMVVGMFVVVAVMLHGINVHVDQPEVARSTEQGAGSKEQNLPSPSGRGAGGEGIAASSPVARLIHVADCRWADDSDAPEVGDDLAPGRKLVLRSGLAELMFQSRRRALLEGPATLEVNSKTSASLQHGKLTVTVEEPGARGFEIDTPGMKYTDLGTEFGVLVAKDGVQEVHVFRGTVQAEVAGSREQGAGSQNLPSPSGRGAGGEGSSHPPIPNPQSPIPVILSANQAIRVTAPNKPIERIAADEKQFVRVEQMAKIVEESSPEFRRWKKFSDELCKRTDLVAYYDFQPEGGGSTVLRNRAATGGQFDGKLVSGAQWSEGRFPGKQAVEFAQAWSGVRLKLDVGLSEATLAAWVRFNNLAEFGAGGPDRNLLASDRWDTRPGMAHWRVHSNGMLSMAICDMVASAAPEGVSNGIDSQSIYSGTGPAGWHFLAMTCNFTTGKLVHYFDGREVGGGTVKGREVNLGEATIGNWNHLGTPPADERPLHGRIDELIILRTAVSPEAIGQMHEATSENQKLTTEH